MYVSTFEAAAKKEIRNIKKVQQKKFKNLRQRKIKKSILKKLTFIKSVFLFRRRDLVADDDWRLEPLGQRLDLVWPQKSDIGLVPPEASPAEVRDDGSELWHDPTSFGRGLGFGWLDRLGGGWDGDGTGGSGFEYWRLWLVVDLAHRGHDRLEKLSRWKIIEETNRLEIHVGACSCHSFPK